MNDTEERLQRLREVVFNAVEALESAVKANCSGDHQPRQHRDGKPPWCRQCGRDSAGVLQSKKIDVS